MSQSVAQFLLETRGTQRDLDAFVVAACFDRAGTTAAFALGDGTLRLVPITDREAWRTAEAHDGAILASRPMPRPPASSPAATTENSAGSAPMARHPTSPTSA